MSISFNYEKAFSRNIGWVTPQEQQILRNKRVAIAGGGGVGGVHLLTLARLGITKFHLADFDSFDIHNFNRQVGAMMSTVDQPKSEVLARMARDINPEIEIKIFPEGVNQGNLREFLAGVDLYVDALDFFAFDARQQTFAMCAELRIPATTAAPLGMGAALLNFLPGGMSFEEYFQWGDLPELDKAIRFVVGLAPAGLHRPYLVVPEAVNFAERRGPSTMMACQMCAGVVGTEALKILLGRGKVLAAPHGVQFDAYRNKLARTWRPGGNRHPLHRLMIAIAGKQMRSMLAAATPAIRNDAASKDIPPAIYRILELARWAPSGDNTQCWRFEVVAADHLVVHAYDTRADTVYDLDGHPSQISMGALLETISIAASAQGLRASCTRRADSPVESPLFDLRFTHDPGLAPSPLLDAVEKRSVQRRPMSTRPLRDDEKQALQAAVGPDYVIDWIEGFGPKLKTARLMFNNAKLRLTMPEAYEVHRRIIHWNATRSPDRVPDQALGVDKMTLKLMKWAMVSWKRLSTMNAVMGTWAPRLQMDLVPSLACAAHFVIKAKRAPQGIDDYVEAGCALQRFWLTLTRLGLFMQPEMTPLIFSKYVREGRSFTSVPALHERARRLAQEAAPLIFTDQFFPVYMGRLGAGPAPTARSERLPVEQLLYRPDTGASPAP
ncbi:ThiF family adenylyltransferase [Herbaspirillum sp. NPDC087042]|uniref:ThiF family adenylyltransferase n=1 Tax=Herbaspirillum sp. NPDC087042 TaxID=3364004 RepID=UPI00381CC552